MKTTQIIDIKKVFIPSIDGDTGMPIPYIKGFMWITNQEVEVDNDTSIMYEYIPDHIDLCVGGNAKRIGQDKIQML